MQNLSHNKLWPTNLSNPSKLIYEIGEAYSLSRMEANTLDPRYSVNPVDAVKLFDIDFLTAGRIGEMLRPPYPRVKLTKKEVDGRNVLFVLVQKQNEKHFQKSVPLDPNAPVEYKKRRKLDLALSERSIISQQWPLLDVWEVKLWSNILGSSLEDVLEVERVIDVGARLGGYEKRTRITHYFKNNFKTDLTDGNVVFKNEGLNPHLLRHFRCYELLCVRGWSVPLVQTYLGWSDANMYQTYVYITRQLSELAQFDMLKGQIKLPEKLPRYG